MLKDSDLIVVERISTTIGNEPMLDIFYTSVDDIDRVGRYLKHTQTYGRYRIMDTPELLEWVKDHIADYTLVSLYGRKFGENWQDMVPDWLEEKLVSFNTRGRWYDTNNIYGDRVYQFYNSYFPVREAPDHDIAPQWVHDTYDEMDTRKDPNSLEGWLARRLGEYPYRKASETVA